MMTMFATDHLQLALWVDAALRTPVTSEVNTPTEIAAIFSYSAYEKGNFNFSIKIK